jgi:hypothetical protein
VDYNRELGVVLDVDVGVVYKTFSCPVSPLNLDAVLSEVLSTKVLKTKTKEYRIALFLREYLVHSCRKEYCFGSVVDYNRELGVVLDVDVGVVAVVDFDSDVGVVAVVDVDVGEVLDMGVVLDVVFE